MNISKLVASIALATGIFSTINSEATICLNAVTKQETTTDKNCMDLQGSWQAAPSTYKSGTWPSVDLSKSNSDASGTISSSGQTQISTKETSCKDQYGYWVTKCKGVKDTQQMSADERKSANSERKDKIAAQEKADKDSYGSDQEASDEDLSAENTTGYGGSYTGRGRKKTTDDYNTAAQYLKDGADQVANNIVSMTGQNQQATIARRGNDASQKEVVHAEAEVARSGAKALEGSAVMYVAGAGSLYAARLAEHTQAANLMRARSADEAENNRRERDRKQSASGYKQSDTMDTTCAAAAAMPANPGTVAVSNDGQTTTFTAGASTMGADCIAYLKAKKTYEDAEEEYAEREKYRVNNARMEIGMQKELKTQEAMLIGKTAAEGGQKILQAQVIRKAANEAERLAELNKTKSSYAFTGNQNNQNNDQLPNIDAITTDGNVVAQGDQKDKDIFDGADPFNPENLDPNAPQGPMATNFNSAPGGKDGGQGGGGQQMAGAGDTSAAKDDKKEDQGPASKSQNGGTYASEGNGYRRGGSNSGSGTSVGMDHSFLDMLKKMLPGDAKEEPLAKAELTPDERSPASDSAAVLKRNQNIFEEVNKRYKKKLADGSVSI